MSTSLKLHGIRFIHLFILAMLVNILAQAAHETGHHVVYQVMGHEPVWAFTKIVQISETPPTDPEGWTEKSNPDGTTSWLKLKSLPTGTAANAFASAAGPLAGLFSAVFGLALTRRGGKSASSKQVWLAFVLTSSLVAVLYYLRSPMRGGGDEYDIAVQLGIAKSFVEIPLALGFFGCLVLGLRMLPSWGVRLKWLGIMLLGSVATGLPMAMLDPFIIAQVDAGNPWFQPVLGYSLPVLLTIVVALIGVWAWYKHHQNL